MTSTPSRLVEQHHTLVLDASVALNLLGTGRPDVILRLLNRKILIEDFALREVITDPSGGSGREKLDVLQSAGLLRYNRMSDSAYLLFLEMTGAAPPDDLDDGEAATIALAEEEAAIPLLDDKKATRIAMKRRPDRVVLNSVDLLSSPNVIDGLSRDELSGLVFAALRNARMRVSQPYRSWVITLIGGQRAKLCPSLGRTD